MSRGPISPLYVVLRSLTALTVVLVACAAIGASATSASSGRHKPADLRSLWHAFPLDQKRGPQRKTPRKAVARPTPREDTSGGGDLWIFVVAVAVAAAAALFATNFIGGRRRGDAHPNSSQGGRTMTRSTQKNWFRRGGDPAERPSASASDPEKSEVPTKRIAEYARGQRADMSSDTEGSGEHQLEAESEPVLHRSAGEEVDAILQSARDTAAKLEQAAKEEAEQTRAEAKAAATREAEKAQRVRADAEAYAARLRSEAEAEAAKLRMEAEHVATELVEAAREKLVAAEAEAAQTLRAAEESARARVDVLQAEVRHHENRLEHLLTVFHGMSFEVEEILGKKTKPGRDLEPAETDRAVEPARERAAVKTSSA